MNKYDLENIYDMRDELLRKTNFAVRLLINNRPYTEEVKEVLDIMKDLSEEIDPKTFKTTFKDVLKKLKEFNRLDAKRKRRDAMLLRKKERDLNKTKKKEKEVEFVDIIKDWKIVFQKPDTVLFTTKELTYEEWASHQVPRKLTKLHNLISAMILDGTTKLTNCDIETLLNSNEERIILAFYRAFDEDYTPKTWKDIPIEMLIELLDKYGEDLIDPFMLLKPCENKYESWRDIPHEFEEYSEADN